MFDIAKACGLDDTDIDNHQLEQPLHRLLVEPVRQLKIAGEEAGFTLTIASGYRSFARQLSIWNGKVAGERAVLDDNECPLDITQLSDVDKLWAILRWSALPGASRHHFGTELDIYDPNLLPPGGSLQLTLAETQGEGVFAELHTWLDEYLMTSACGFFRPYIAGDFGVAPEPWHLSYGPVAFGYQQCLTVAGLARVVAASEILLKDTILANLAEIFARYIQVPWGLYPRGIIPGNNHERL